MTCPRCAMTNPASYEGWDALVSLVQAYCVRKYGSTAEGITIHLTVGGNHSEPFPRHVPHPPMPFPAPARSEASQGHKRPGWVRGDGPDHLSDFTHVWWPPLGLFRLTPKQARVVAVLWEAMEDGTDVVSQDALLRAAESDCTRLRDIFGRSPAWGTLVVTTGGGMYRLAPRDVSDQDCPDSE